VTHDPTALRPLLLSWAALMILLGSTLGLAFVPLGSGNLVVALSIGTLKALIVLAVFMELREGPSLKWVFAAAGFFWLMIMFVLSATDYLTRAMLLLG
jgi:cytochrome c oxidase subunit IV